jgi:DNA-binding MarR family transcriptional regulator
MTDPINFSNPPSEFEKIRELLPPDEFVLYVMGRIGELLAETFENVLAPFGLNRRQFQVLWLLHRDGQRRQTELGSAFSINKNTIVNIIEFLERQELVERIQNSDRPWEKLVRITEKGCELLVEAVPKFSVWVNRVTPGWSESDFRLVGDRLLRVLPVLMGLQPGEAIGCNCCIPPRDQSRSN